MASCASASDLERIDEEGEGEADLPVIEQLDIVLAAATEKRGLDVIHEMADALNNGDEDSSGDDIPVTCLAYDGGECVRGEEAEQQQEDFGGEVAAHRVPSLQ